MSVRKLRRWGLNLLMGAVLALGGGLLAVVGLLLMVAYKDQPARRWASQLLDADPAVRIAALRRVGDKPPLQVRVVMYRRMTEERNRSVLVALADAACRTGEPGLAVTLRYPADEGIDDLARAKLIVAAARVSHKNPDPSLIEWLREGAASSDRWRRAGSAAGLLEVGQCSGGEVLISMMDDADPALRRFVTGEFARFAGPMAEAVGYPVERPSSRDAGLSDRRLAGLRQFWEGHANDVLLRAIFVRLDNTDTRWSRISFFLANYHRLRKWTQG